MANPAHGSPRSRVCARLRAAGPMRVSASPRSGWVRAALGVTLLCLLGGATWGQSAATADDLALARELSGSYERCSSRLMVRVLAQTDRAALDLATHDRNVVFHYPLREPPRAPVATLVLADLSFGGVVLEGTLSDSLAGTPLTAPEHGQALCWPPLLRYLTEWDYDACEKLLDAGIAVSEPKWGNADLIRPLQEIATAYLHGSEIWVRIDFRPELAAWLPVTDSDGDGYPECFGRLADSLCNPVVLARIRADYAGRPLAGADLAPYFHTLASVWYPSLMTVVLEPAQARPWPGQDTEPEVLDVLHGRTFGDPFMVLRSKPFSKALYGVFLLAAPGLGAAVPALGGSGGGAAVVAPESGHSGALAGAPEPLDRRVSRERALWGGSWEAWCASLAEFHGAVRGILEARPAELHGLVGRDGFLFFRADLEFLLSGDLRAQVDGRDPFPAIVDFNKQLRERGIDCLLVVIPTKAEVYPEKLTDRAPPGALPYVAPYARKVLEELAAAGVECVDLLPDFVAHRDDPEGLLYMPQDTHWTPRGLELAATLIAQRIKDYPWYAGMQSQRLAYTTRSAVCQRLGDICPMLTDGERKPYRPMKLEAHQVFTPAGDLYTDSPDSPIAMLGDSFTGVFQLEDCRHAGLSAQVAKETGVPIDLIMAHGSGPQIRIRLARCGHEAIAAKRLVIWTVVARDLYRYRSPWSVIPLP